MAIVSMKGYSFAQGAGGGNPGQGGSVEVVQSLGSSTTAVMSQKAVTKAVCPMVQVGYSLSVGVLQASGEVESSGFPAWRTTSFIKAPAGRTFEIKVGMEPDKPYVAMQVYDENKAIVKDYYTGSVPSTYTPSEDGYFRLCGVAAKGFTIKSEINVKDVYNVPDVTVNYVGMSIWWYDGKTLGNGIGGGSTAYGYQSLLNDRFAFKSTTGTSYCYSGNSLGGTSATDGQCILATSKTNQWAACEGKTIWTLDTITNDFKRNIPIGKKSDYDNNTGVTTYYGALRVFKDKIASLTNGSLQVIVANALHRDNSGYDSSTTNTVGATLLDYEKALMIVAIENGWWFVDQFRLSGITDDNINTVSIDGLHLNNLGFRMAVIPWFNVMEAVLNKFEA